MSQLSCISEGEFLEFKSSSAELSVKANVKDEIEIGDIFMVKEEHINLEDQKVVMDKYRDAIGKDLKTKVKNAYDKDGNKVLQCKVCGYVGKSTETLRAHLTEHRPGNPYSCNVCGHLSRTLAQLNVHKNIHVETKSYACDECPKTFKTYGNLNGHIRNCHSKEKFECPTCSKTFPTKQNLKVHLPVHKEERHQFKCEHCQAKFLSQKGWIEHLKRHIGVPNSKVFHCYFCDYQCELRTTMELHLRQHTMEKPFKCRVCGIRLKVQGDHMKVHASLPLISCHYEDCKVTFKRRGDLEKHVEYIHEASKRQKLTCKFEDCNYSTVRERDFKRHVKSVHERDYNFRCKDCDKGFSDKTLLNIHIKQNHSEERPFKCNFKGCNSAFVTIHRLKYHKRIHLVQDGPGEACCFCGKEYQKAVSLNYHLRTKHAEETGKKMQQIGCYFCGKNYQTIASLAKHMRNHTKESPYRCTQTGCEKLRMRSQEVLTYHLSAVHGVGKSYKRDPSAPLESCPFCEKAFRSKTYLLGHIAGNHSKTAKVFECKECEFKSYHRKALLSHVKGIHMKYKYKCEVCETELSSKFRLAKHVQQLHS